MTKRGTCMEHETDFAGTYTFLFSQNPSDPGSCYHCVKIYVRTVNIVEKQETGCVTLENGEIPTLQNICKRMDPETQLITLFAENYTPINCRSSLEGVFHFAYQVSNKKSSLARKVFENYSKSLIAIRREIGNVQFQSVD